MEIVYQIFFVIISGVLLLSALGVVLFKNIIYSAVSLIVTFLSVAGIFVLLNADFVAISQIIIYGVGITIILIFAIMLTSREESAKLWFAIAPRTLFALGISGGLFLLIAYAVTGGFTKLIGTAHIFNQNPQSAEAVKLIAQEGTAKIIGNALLQQYVLPFEILSILLLAAILGAVVIAKKDQDNLVNPTTELLED